MTELPQGYLLRRPDPEDGPAIVDLMNTCDVADRGNPDSTLEDLTANWALPRFDRLRDSWMVTAPDRSVAGYAWVWDRVPHIDLQGDVYVHPDHRELRLEDRLLDRMEERGREHRTAAPRDKPVLLALFAPPSSSLAQQLVSRGYARVRTFLRMTIELSAGWPDPPRPEGIVVRPYRPGVDERPIHHAIEEAFADHFRFAPESHEDWLARRVEHPEFDPSLWLVACEGKEVVGAILPYQFGGLSWVRELGVRPIWRGRGVGKLLLLESFRLFHSRGSRRVSLGVDSENATGATRLYEDVGMREEERHDLFQRVLG
jgi:mycothiol synthase